MPEKATTLVYDPPQMTQLAPDGSRCEICFRNTDEALVFWTSLIIRWIPPDKELSKHWGFRRCTICNFCQGIDGGLVSTLSVNGFVVYRTSSNAERPGMLVIAPLANVVEH